MLNISLPLRQLKIAVDAAAKVSPASSVIQTVQCLVISYDGREIKVNATDLETWVEYSFAHESISDPGKVCVNADRLSKALSHAPKECVVHIRYFDDAPTAEFVLGRSSYKLPVTNDKGYMDMPEFSGDPVWVGSSSLIKSGLKGALPFYTKGCSPVILGIYFDVLSEGVARIRASNGHELFFWSTGDDGYAICKDDSCTTITSCIDASSIKHICEIACSFDEVEIFAKNSSIMLRGGNGNCSVKYSARTLSVENIPRFENIIIKNADCVISVDKMLLKDVILRAMLTAELMSIDFSLDPSGSVLGITSKSEAGDFGESIALDPQAVMPNKEYESFVKFCVSGKYMLDCLSVIPDERVSISLNTSNKAPKLEVCGDVEAPNPAIVVMGRISGD